METVQNQAAHAWPRPSLTVDAVVVSRRKDGYRVLLIERKNPPFQGSWALPGGFVQPFEPLEAAVRRELTEETGIEPGHVEQLYTFGDPGRDPRGWTVSVAYLAVLDDSEIEAVHPKAGDDARAVGWFELEAPPALAFDHADILAHARKRLD
jgi:8-oxo-dGTP diphosphatase